ncbi:signal transduction protein [Heyndrickxia sporothermodurans]|uniref:signal transduction protein n=1 Tax=Heyndrickxia sporothermodurans TaxID=46224 RepID=UPI001F2717F2|nr:signal transduction protein [Heyndrickxia sporothermodurans]MEB6549063.1 signal transduction protein [Heyndrickxia sporothermodurans]MED3779415.1 signal transduction protein [Heyndrickxia sporothermodurans]
MAYTPKLWQDRIFDSNGKVIQEGVPFSAGNMNNIEEGVQLSHFDIGLLALFAMHQGNINQLEISKYKKQRLLQGQATINNTTTSIGGVFRDSEPFVTIALNGYQQINAPNYDISLTPISSDDMGAVGRLEAYDKTQNGFKVKMTGSAKTVSFMWTLINPNV